MSNQALSTLLQEASLSYKQGDYQACVALLNDCLLLSPSQTFLLSNRALAHYHMGMLELALSDLYSCLANDHLNYTAHFNLFSIHHLQHQLQQAFQHLACCLSSAYTLTARHHNDPQAAQKAILYCSNNKEALLLRGLLHLEQLQYGHCLQMLSRALKHESSPVTQAEIKGVMRQVREMGGLPQSEEQPKFVGGKGFSLKTILPTPTPEQYPSAIKPMIEQFNILYLKLTSCHQTYISSHQSFPLLNSRESMPSIPSSLGEPSLSYLKEDRTNCLTAHNSIANESVSDDPHLSRGSCTLFADSTRHLAGDSSHSVIPEETSSLADNWSESMAAAESDQPARESKAAMISFIVYWAQLYDQKSLQDIYSVLHYSSKAHYIFRTGLSTSIDGICQWKPSQSVSEPTPLSDKPSPLLLKIYRKRLDTFQDDLLGEAQVQIDRLGTATVNVFRGEELCGTVAVGVAYVE